MRPATTILLLLLLVCACSPDGDDPPTAATPQAGQRGQQGVWHISEYNTGSASRFWQLDIWLPSSTPGIYELSRYPDSVPTAAQVEAARALRQRSWEAAVDRDWFDFERGLADGFHTLPSLDGLHFAHDGYLTDGRILDPERPEFLMYYVTEAGVRLAGFMFYQESHYAHGPQPGGPLTIWHYHIMRAPMCWHGGLPVDPPSPLGECEVGTPEIRTPEMLHVWFVAHPEGDYATSMGLTPELITVLARSEYDL